MLNHICVGFTDAQEFEAPNFTPGGEKPQKIEFRSGLEILESFGVVP